MGWNDLILFVVVFGSVAVAVFFPAVGVPFQPYLLYFMMLLLFLSFLTIDFRALLDRSPTSLTRLALLVVLKLVVLPTGLYGIALLAKPEYALPVLLVSGISTGVVAPFVGALVRADIPQILRMVIVTSLLVPFSLPVLAKILAGSTMYIPLSLMIRLLAIVIFVPMAGVLLLRRMWPGLPERIAQRQFPVSLMLFATINFGVFSRYSDFFFQEPGQLAVSIGIAYILAIVYYAVGFAITPGRPPAERLAWGVSLALMNNVLVIVFSSEFFGPLCPTLAAMYMFPFFTMIVPLRLYANRVQASGSPEGKPA
jgi:bile acid:Na+ symporter, BASS family